MWRPTEFRRTTLCRNATTPVEPNPSGNLGCERRSRGLENLATPKVGAALDRLEPALPLG
jgi:hypothetical protein